MSWYKKSQFDDLMGKGDDFWDVYYDEKDESSYFRGLPFTGTQCTGFACRILQKFGHDRVKIFGFLDQENPGTAAGSMRGGHDFAVVDDRYIVDPWIVEVFNHNITTPMDEGLDKLTNQGVFDINDPKDQKMISVIYGPKEKWKRNYEAEELVK